MPDFSRNPHGYLIEGCWLLAVTRRLDQVGASSVSSRRRKGQVRRQSRADGRAGTKRTTKCNCVLGHAPETVCVCVTVCCGAKKSVGRAAGNNEASHKTQNLTISRSSQLATTNCTYSSTERNEGLV